MNWKGRNEKVKRILFNNVVPVFHSRLMQDTVIRCGCGRALELHSEVYVLKIIPKNGKESYHKHFGSGCGKEVIKLSNEINCSNFANIYFMDPLNVCDEDTVVKGYGLRNYDQQNDPSRYSQFNKEYLIAIFILCTAWGEPYPYGRLAVAIDAIHAAPEANCYLSLGFFNTIIKRDKRNLSQMLDCYRQEVAINAFHNINFDLLHQYVSAELKLKSSIR